MVQLVFLGVFAVFAVGWKPLHKRFRAWAILAAYFFMLLGVLSVVSPEKPDDWQALPLALVFAAVFLFFNRQKPIEQGRSDLVFMILNGHWDLLAKSGVPADEIERMKRLTQEERAALAESLRSTRCGGVGRGHKGLSGYDYRPGGQNDDWGYTYSYGYGVSHIDDDDD